MLQYDEAKWKAWGISDELHKLFVQVWDELFAEDSLDTWQVRTSNAGTILVELLDVVEVATNEHEAYRHNVPTLLAELSRVVSEDPVINTEFPLFRAYTDELTRGKARPMRPDGEEPRRKGEAFDQNDIGANELAELAKKVRVMLGQLVTYRDRLIDAITNLLETKNSREKDRLCRLTMALATDLAASGASTPHLRSGVKVLTSVEFSNFVQRFERLVEISAKRTSAYICRLPVNWPESLLDSGRENIHFTKNYTPITDAENEFYAKYPEGVFADVVVDEAVDLHAARAEAERRLAQVFAGLNLYQVRRTPNIRGELCLVTPDVGVPEIVPPDHTRRDHLPNVKGTLSRLRKLVALEKRLPQEDADQLSSALQYHRLALKAPTDEAKLVNLWIAIECVARRTNGSIIENVCRYTTASFAVNKPKRVLQGLLRYVKPLIDRGGEDNKKLIFPSGNPKRQLPEFLDVLLEDEAGARIRALMAELSQDPLVQYRVWRVWDKTFRSPENLAASIEQHHQNIEWQLRRIYRERNHVIHRGRSRGSIRHLIQHLHVYLVLSFRTLIKELRDHDDWGIPDALEHRRMLYEQFLKILRSPQSAIVPREAIIDPNQLLIRSNGDSTWKPKPSGERGPQKPKQKPAEQTKETEP